MTFYWFSTEVIMQLFVDFLPKEVVILSWINFTLLICELDKINQNLSLKKCEYVERKLMHHQFFKNCRKS